MKNTPMVELWPVKLETIDLSFSSEFHLVFKILKIVCKVILKLLNRYEILFNYKMCMLKNRNAKFNSVLVENLTSFTKYHLYILNILIDLLK